MIEFEDVFGTLTKPAKSKKELTEEEKFGKALLELAAKFPSSKDSHS